MKRDKQIAHRSDKKHKTPFHPFSRKSPSSAIACRTRSRLKWQPTQQNIPSPGNLRYHWEDISLDRRTISEKKTFHKPKSGSGKQQLETHLCCQENPLPVKTSRLKTSQTNGERISSQRTGKSAAYDVELEAVSNTAGQFLVELQCQIYLERVAIFPDHSVSSENDPKQDSDSDGDWEDVGLDVRKTEFLNNTSEKCCKPVACAVGQQGAAVSEDLHVSTTELESRLKEDRYTCRKRKSEYVLYQNTADRTSTSTLVRTKADVQTQTFESSFQTSKLQLVKYSYGTVKNCAQNILPTVEQAELPTVVSDALKSKTVHCKPEESIDELYELDCSYTDVQFSDSAVNSCDHIFKAGRLSDLNGISASCSQEKMSEPTPSTPPHRMIPSEPHSPENSPLYDMPPPSTPAQKRARKAKRQIQLDRWRKCEEMRGRRERYQRRHKRNSAIEEAHSEASSRGPTHVQWKSDLVEVYFFSTDDY